MAKAMDDFDIYGDLEHIESEAKKESKELLALQCTIKQLEEKVDAVEKEKGDILKKNDILLENVSSLLLTAKAELKRKDTIINDLRKQCDNTAFRRGNQTNKGIKGVTKFTQTPVTKLVDTAIQTTSGEETDSLRHKKRNYIDPEPEHYREHHDRESQRGWKKVSNIREISDRDQASTRERVVQRDEDRIHDLNYVRHRDSDGEQYSDRDRDRYRDCDAERDWERDRYRSHHRKKSREGNRISGGHCYERSRDRTAHDLNHKKDLKHNKDHSAKLARNKKIADDYTSTSELDRLNKRNTKSFDYKAESVPSILNSYETRLSNSPEDFGQNSVAYMRLTERHSGQAVDNCVKPNVGVSGITLSESDTTIKIDGYNEQTNIRLSKESSSKRSDDRRAADDVKSNGNQSSNELADRIEISASDRNAPKEKNQNEENESNKKPYVKIKSSVSNIFNCDDHADSVGKNQQKNTTNDLVSKPDTKKMSNVACKTTKLLDKLQLLENKRRLDKYGNTATQFTFSVSEKLIKPLEATITSTDSFSNIVSDETNGIEKSRSFATAHLTSKANNNQKSPKSTIGLGNKDLHDVEKSCMNDTRNHDKHSTNESNISSTKPADKLEKTVDSRKRTVKLKSQSEAIVKQKQCMNPIPKNGEEISTKSGMELEATLGNVSSTSVFSKFHINSNETTNLVEVSQKETDHNPVREPTFPGIQQDGHSKAVTVSCGDTNFIDEMNNFSNQKMRQTTSKAPLRIEYCNEVDVLEKKTPECCEIVLIPPVMEKSLESMDISQHNTVPTTTIASSSLTIPIETNNSDVVLSLESVNITSVKRKHKGGNNLEKRRSTRKKPHSKLQQVDSSHESKKKVSIKSPEHVKVPLMQNASQQEEESSKTIKNSSNNRTRVSDDNKHLACSTLCDFNTHTKSKEELDHVASVLTLQHVGEQGKSSLKATNSSPTVSPDERNNKQSLSPNLIVLPTEKSTQSSLGLRSRRTKSCYFEPENSETGEETSLETFFKNFDGIDSVVEANDTPCFATPDIVERKDVGNDSDAIGMNVSSGSLCPEQVHSAEKKAYKANNHKSQLCSLENIRERLRKKQGSNSSKTPIPLDQSARVVANYPKRRLSVESAPTLSSKKHKIDIDIRASTNKLLTSPTAGSLSSPYFSQIALPITSSLDSIPSKSQSPCLKRTVETVLTPMVVVHSPAKPSDQASLYNDLEVFSNPADDYASIEQIMDSLFRTPIKNEPTYYESPPNADDLVTNHNEQNVISDNGLSFMLAHSTPLSTKPLSRSNNKSGIERKEKSSPVRSTLRACDLNDRRDNVNTTKMVDTTTREKPSEPEPAVTSLDSMNKLDQCTKHFVSTPLTENNNLKSQTVPSKAIEAMKQPIKNSKSSNKPSMVDKMSTIPPSTVFKTPISVLCITQAAKESLSMETQREFKGDQKNGKSKMEHWKSGKVSVGVSAAKSGSENFVLSSNNCTNDASLRDKNARSSNSDGKISDDQIAPRMRSRQTTNVDDVEIMNTLDNATCNELEAAIEKTIRFTIQADSYDAVGPCSSERDIESEKPIDQNLGQSMASLSHGNEKLIKNNMHQTHKRQMSHEEVSTVSVQGEGVGKQLGLVSSAGVEKSVSPKIGNCSPNISLAEDAVISSTQSIQKNETASAPAQPVRYVREMRIVKESPSLMRVFIRRK